MDAEVRGHGGGRAEKNADDDPPHREADFSERREFRKCPQSNRQGTHLQCTDGQRQNDRSHGTPFRLLDFQNV